MSWAITNADSFYLSMTDGDKTVFPRKFTVQFGAIDGNILPLYWDERPYSPGRGLAELDYTTTTVNGASPSSAEELKTFLEDLILSGMARDYYMEVARGLVPGQIAFSKFGYNSSLGTGAYETIWSQNSGTWTPMASAETLDVVSSSTEDDNSVGTGAWSILITGIDANREIQTEVVVMDGTTTVTTSNTWLGVNRVAVISAGTAKYNVGNITIDSTTTGDVQAYVKAQDSLTQQLIFSVPSTHDAWITRIIIDSAKIVGGGNPEIEIFGYYELNGVRYNAYTNIIDTSVQDTKEGNVELPVKIPAGSVWYFQAKPDTANTFIRGRVEQILIEV